MATYLLNCTVCEKNFGTRETWTRHLFQEEHQEKARLEYWKWEEIAKKCALVLHFNSPEKMEDDSDFVMLLWNHLKITEGGRKRIPLITDVVWWRERPHIVILQFETRSHANQAYHQMMMEGQATTPEPPALQIGNNVQCKKLMDLLELEGRNPNQDSRTPPEPSTSLGSPPANKRKNTASSSVLAPTASSPCLVTEFNRLLKSVEVPSSVILQAKQIIEKLKCLKVTEYPSCQFTVFRNIYLKIRHPFCNDILIFTHGGATPAAPQSYQELDIQDIARDVMIFDYSLDYKFEKYPKYEGSQFFKQGPLEFWVITDPAYLVEVRLNQLLEYMLTFDIRCAPLLSCVHYFCTLNSCYFGESPAKGEAIEWLLIFFLSKRKIIPTVRQILEEPHQPIMLPNSGRNIDIGFSTCHCFANRWKEENGTKLLEGSKEEFVSDVLKVFQNFLNFLCNRLPNGNYMLNTKDAELLNRWKVILEPKGSWNSELSDEEMELIKGHVDGEVSKWPFTLVHPLVVHLKLGYNADEFHRATNIMKRGVSQLESFLSQREKEGNWPDNFKDLESVLKGEDVSKEEDRKSVEAPKSAEEEDRKFAWEEAWELAQRETREKAEMEFQKEIETKALKEEQKKVLKKVGKSARKEAKKKAKKEAKALMEAREKMKLLRVEEKEEK